MADTTFDDITTFDDFNLGDVSAGGSTTDNPLEDFSIVPFDSGIGEGDLGSITSNTDTQVAEVLGMNVTGVDGAQIDSGNFDSEVTGGGLSVEDFNSANTNPFAPGLDVGILSGISDVLDSLLGIDGGSPSSPSAKNAASNKASPLSSGGGSSKPSKPSTAKPATQAKPVAPTKPLIQYVAQKDAQGNTSLTTIGILLVVLVAIGIGVLVANMNKKE